jgi:putative ABC transport system substrate-binding protein
MKNKRKRLLAATVGVFLLTFCLSARAQNAPRVGILAGGSRAANKNRINAFRQGLRDLGYTEGKNLIIEERWAEGNINRLNPLGLELAQLNVKAILSAGPTVTRALKEANVMIPIVMGFDDDPVGSHFIASLAQPGGNITGLSTLSPGLSGKQVEILKDILPRLLRIAVFGSMSHPGTSQSLNEAERAAAGLGLQSKYFNMESPADIQPTFENARLGRADAAVVLTSVLTNSNRKSIAEAANKSRLPAIYYTAEWMEVGGLLTYGASYSDLFRRAATYVDKILKGAKPADLPVEQPKKFEFVINLKTAKQIGLVIPPNVLARADRVIR